MSVLRVCSLFFCFSDSVRLRDIQIEPVLFNNSQTLKVRSAIMVWLSLLWVSLWNLLFVFEKNGLALIEWTTIIDCYSVCSERRVM